MQYPAACALAVVIGGAAISTRVSGQQLLRAADFGAFPDDGVDDRPAIQAALDAAAGQPGSDVSLDGGTYDIVVVLAYGSGGTAGHHGLLIPGSTGLTGAGKTETILRIRAGSAPATSVGNGIINKGYQTANRNYGAGGDIRISDLRIETPDLTNGATGNMVGFAHLDGAVVRSVSIGASRYHGVELNRSRNVTLEDCDFTGEHPGSATLQFDIGSIGAKSLIPTTTVLENVTVRRCRFEGRKSETVAGKVIELGHTNGTCILRNISFQDCYIETLSAATSACVTNDNPPAQEISGLRFERCHFHGVQEAASGNGVISLTMQGAQQLSDLAVRDCLFTGAFWQGIVVITTEASFNTGHQQRRGIVIENNRIAPVLDRMTQVSGGSMRLIAASACRDIAIRGNLIEFPSTAVNLTLTGQITGIQAANCIDARVEDNVMTWANQTAATSPVPAARLVGISAPAWLLEQNGVQANQCITGNIFLYPPGGVASPISMTTGIATTSWAAGGPWVSGMISGNFATGLSASSQWRIQHDLSGAANIGEIAAADPSRSTTTGWYACNGALLTSFDSGNHRLARVNANRCGYGTTLPVIPGSVVRLHGPLTGEGLIADFLKRHSSVIFRGTADSLEDLRGIPSAGNRPEDIRVVRRPLSVFRWNPGADQAGERTVVPLDAAVGSPGAWELLNTGANLMHDDADMDNDGLTTIQERTFLLDPSVPGGPDVLRASRAEDGTMQLRFRCASGPGCPSVCLLTSNDLVTWSIESYCPPGGEFTGAAAVSVREAPILTGREVIVSGADGRGRFWRLVAGH